MERSAIRGRSIRSHWPRISLRYIRATLLSNDQVRVACQVPLQRSPVMTPRQAPAR
jgi:hypothetical protein